ncbi:Hint domain-containing protein [Pararhodobacter sp.]|uniref:Hint domain-containing protein n=1 Tax=Pararhodobacter sp. TaxID=2127056 RepID=UPI002FDCCDE8
MSDHDVIAEGMIAGTLVATDLGWQPVEDLQAGDRVVTFDNGMRPLKAVGVSTLWTAANQAPRAVWPLLVPERALGNRTALTLLPEQAVLIESDEAEAMFGDPFTLVTAASLEGYKGITRVPPSREMKIVTLQFAEEEVVYANGTTLVHCPNARPGRVTSADAMMSFNDNALYFRLPRAQSEMLMMALRNG